MKKIISKIRNKRLKGNISLLVILILLASSVIALLSISQIQHLITYGNMTFNYFRAFYLAKAGTELGLTEVYNRENGFEDTIIGVTEKDDGTFKFDEIIEKNFLGNDNEYEGAKPYFNMEIKSNFKFLTDDIRYTDECADDNKITLQPGDGIMLSLFKDNSKNITDILNPDKINITPMSDSDIKNLDFGNPGGNFKFGIFAYDDKGENMNDIIVKDGNILNQFLNSHMVSGTRRYLTIKNSGSDSISFCINGKGDIPYSDSLITVRGNYADMEVGLQSVVKKGVPDWTLNVLGY